MGMHKKVALIGLVILCLLAYHVLSKPGGTASSELLDPAQEPDQEPTSEQPFDMNVAGYSWKVTPTAEYRICARVLSTESYRSGWQSTLCPVDLALGWGDMADPAVDRWITWSQSNRWYFYRWKAGSPYQNARIDPQSANVHILPASSNLNRAVKTVERGDIVLLEGLLVFLDGARNGGGNYWWHSSLSRNDTGDGSCELLYLKRLVDDGKEYR